MASTTFEFTANLNNCTVSSVAQAVGNVDMNSNNQTTLMANNCEFTLSSSSNANKDIVAKLNTKVSGKT
jgi:hypothetical protein